MIGALQPTGGEVAAVRVNPVLQGRAA
jgi:hypothetical protein